MSDRTALSRGISGESLLRVAAVFLLVASLVFGVVNVVNKDWARIPFNLLIMGLATWTLARHHRRGNQPVTGADNDARTRTRDTPTWRTLPPSWTEYPRRQKVRIIVVALVLTPPVLFLALGGFGSSGRIVVLVVAGAFFGSCFLLMAIRSARLRRHPRAEACLQTAEFTVRADPEAVERSARAAITRLGASIDSEQSGNGTLHAQVPGGWRSFGEIVAIHMSWDDNAGTTAVRIESSCLYTGTAVDWGKNRQNVMRLRREIESR